MYLCRKRRITIPELLLLQLQRSYWFYCRLRFHPLAYSTTATPHTHVLHLMRPHHALCINAELFGAEQCSRFVSCVQSTSKKKNHSLANFFPLLVGLQSVCCPAGSLWSHLITGTFLCFQPSIQLLSALACTCSTACVVFPLHQLPGTSWYLYPYCPICLLCSVH